MAQNAITKDIPIEDLTEDYPFAVKYLSEKGIRCIVCGEPIWGTLEEAAKEKGFNDDQIQQFVDELNQKASEGGDSKQQPEKNINVDKLDS
ncbi:MAG: DUF1858 domain-containing protein [Bacteroidales bacterium]|nr:DUF1858 domain-containing protein [Bacteroidales bacterium]